MATLNPSVQPLSSFPLIHTNNAEALRESVEHAYRKSAMEFVGRNRTIRAIMNHCQLKKIGIGYAEFGADILWGFPPSPIAVHVFPIGGQAEIVTDKHSVVVKKGHSAAISPSAGFSMKNSSDYQRLMLTIDAEALASTIAVLTGESVSAPLCLNLKPHTKLTKLLEGNFKFLVQQLTINGFMPPIVMAELEQSLIVTFLHANQHNYSDRLNADMVDITPREVRKAEEYIEANWDRPLDLVSLATIANASIRSLSRKFRQSRGYSLNEFLKRVRLHHARRLLWEPNVRASVSEVASACGFVSLARFANDYFNAFGEFPYDADRSV